ncbi:type VII toxin-antitoxin system HepT family RNase toxin [Cyanobacterium aponinum]|uniref:type VII toxin-antitoxin system HepT family RNase toxin n=1 Tax=Cyanobacterium aponinum TaxID=379064 RepID=UPI000C12D8F7|nr:DUF86 domain-containing protein [Cyanobacterium aponinum]PHV64003.1 hypothetical protein CSQ80_01780 [Cyanobacterium aponinum IPPAS B-1201]
MIDVDRILERLKFMTIRLNRLKQFESLALESYLDQLDSQLIAERILELIIQSAIDINNHIIRKGLKLEEVTGKESFLVLKNHGILSRKLAEELSKSTNFRNLLAHEYLDINDHKVFELIPKALKQYSLYVLEIKQYLDSL